MLNKMKKMAVSVATAGALLLTLGAGIAAAQPPSPPQVDASKSGSIHLTKYDNAEHAVAPTGAGSQTIPDGSNPLKGIEFTLTRVLSAPEIGDLKAAVTTRVDNEKLKKLAALRAPEVEAAKAASTAGWGFGEEKTETTNAEGKIDWEGLELGVYLLQETGTHTADKSYKRSPASLIFLPTTDPNHTDWLTEGSKYAVWVYPKNSIEDNLKTVDDQNKQVGDNITYTLAASVPALPVQKPEAKPELEYNLNNFALWDHLDEHLQLLNPDSVKVKLGTAEDSATALDRRDDFVASVYTSTVPANPKTTARTAPQTDSTKGGQKLAVSLTTAGLAKVAAAKKNNADNKVFFSFTPKVIKSGVVPNQAVLYKTYGAEPGIAPDSNASLPFNPPVALTDPDVFKTNTVVSAWGKITVTKTDDKDKALKGAKFKVYGVDKKNVLSNDPLTINGKSEFEADTADGNVFTIDGLHATDFANNQINQAADTVKQYVKYALVETQAPAGYELSPQPLLFTVNLTSTNKDQNGWSMDENGLVTPSTDNLDLIAQDQADSTAASTTTGTLSRTATVVNIKVKPRLPLTGGAGIAIFGILGAGLLLGGLYAAKRNS